MDTKDIPNSMPSPWIPEQDQALLALLGKLGEEAAELSARCCRAVISGADYCDPDTGRTNLAHIADEVADVQSLVAALFMRGHIDGEYVHDRQLKKMQFQGTWFNSLRKHT